MRVFPLPFPILTPPARTRWGHRSVCALLRTSVCLLSFVPIDAPSRLLETAGDSAGGPWSLRMAESFMRRNPETIAYAEDPRSDKWTYEQGVMLEALRQLWSRTKDPKYSSYIRKNIDRFVTDDGTIRTYEYETFNLDNIATGRALLHLHTSTGDEKYRVAAQMLMKQLANQPRTASGGFWHKKIYPNQMWLDGLYMAEPFYAAYARQFGEADAFDDIARQFALIEAHTRDSATGLLYHAWDESRQQRWADPVAGHSPHFWGRAIGWYAMALVDVLDYFPVEHPRRTEMIEIFRRLAVALLKSRDRDTALWYQVVDMPGRAGNYLESSASCMFTYAFAKGARKGYLEAEFRRSARESFEGILKHKVTIDSLGMLSLRDVCQVGGLGGNPYRDGSYEYYIGEKKRTNDFKGVGPFIMAALELEQDEPGPVRWKSSLMQPAPWYGSDEAVRTANTVLLYQRPGGGWPKNIDMTLPLTSDERAALSSVRTDSGSTIDNGATYTQMRFLARVNAAGPDPRFSGAFIRGLDYLLRAQYANGGWPQFYPLRSGYYSCITFNDDAMTGVLDLLQDIVDRAPAFRFIDSLHREKSRQAIQRGVACILKCQIKVKGRLTVWCAQHDQRTLAPAAARSYELPSLSGQESVGIVRFLMRIRTPSSAVIGSVEGAIRWFRRSKLTGMRIVTDSLAPNGSDRIVVSDSDAPPMWARFYDIASNKPFFCSRDGVPRTSLSEISWERRNHYGWLGYWPEQLLRDEYPIWRKRHLTVKATR